MKLWASSSEGTVNIKPDQTTDFTVTAQTDDNCVLNDSVRVTVDDCLNRLFMPNAFTPNQDGKNDIIKPIVYGYLVKYDFSIYNRWGQRVFYSENQNEGWNGRFKGVSQNEGSFVWLCHYQFEGEAEQTGKGSFVLIR